MAKIYFVGSDMLVDTNVPIQQVLDGITRVPKVRRRMHWIEIAKAGVGPLELGTALHVAIEQAGNPEDATVETTEDGGIELHWTTQELESQEACDKRVAQEEMDVRDAYEAVGRMTQQQLEECDMERRIGC